jgi:hypothetical protein
VAGAIVGGAIARSAYYGGYDYPYGYGGYGYGGGYSYAASPYYGGDYGYDGCPPSSGYYASPYRGYYGY